MGKKTSEKLSDWAASFFGSWPFIVWSSIFIIAWMLFNTYSIFSFDKPPFIGLNLILSCVAAYQAPLVLMAANRQAKLDRRRDDDDYRLDKDTNKRIKHIEEILKTKFHE